MMILHMQSLSTVMLMHKKCKREKERLGLTCEAGEERGKGGAVSLRYRISWDKFLKDFELFQNE